MSDVLGYLLNIDDPDERKRTEEQLRNDPEAMRALLALEKALAPLEADQEPPAPPADLAERTLARLADHITGEALAEVPVPPAAAEMTTPASPERWRRAMSALDRADGGSSRWRRADFIVLASIVMVGFTLMMAAVPALRQKHDLQACQNHLRQLYQALDAYADTHQNRYPQVSEKPPRNFAASFLPQLQEAGLVPLSERPGCPAADSLDFAAYAYTLGYRDENGQLWGLRRDPALPNWDTLPIAADRPAPDHSAPNPVHRSGQNVLFCGGNVRFCTTSAVGVGGDDIYHNSLGQVGAGRGMYDTCLGVGTDLP